MGILFSTCSTAAGGAHEAHNGGQINECTLLEQGTDTKPQKLHVDDSVQSLACIYNSSRCAVAASSPSYLLPPASYLLPPTSYFLPPTTVQIARDQDGRAPHLLPRRRGLDPRRRARRLLAGGLQEAGRASWTPGPTPNREAEPCLALPTGQLSRRFRAAHTLCHLQLANGPQASRVRWRRGVRRACHLGE